MPFARLNPHNPRLGFVKKSHTITKPQALRFLEARGWYEVSDEVAEVLKTVPQQERFPRGPRAFSVAATREDAVRIDAELQALIRSETRTQVVGTPDAPARAETVAKATPARRPGQRTMVAAPEPEEDDEDQRASIRTRRRRSSAAATPPASE